MRHTRWTDLVVVMVITTGASWGVLQGAYEHLPAIPRTTFISLVVVALAGVSAWSSVRSRLRGADGAKPITPLQLARLVPLAKALSVVGTLIIGLWLGLLLTVVSNLDLSSHRRDGVTGLLGLLPSIVILASGIALERLCRVPPSSDNGRDGDAG